MKVMFPSGPSMVRAMRYWTMLGRASRINKHFLSICLSFADLMAFNIFAADSRNFKTESPWVHECAECGFSIFDLTLVL